MKSRFVTVEEMAEMVSVAPNTIYRILRADQQRPPDLRRIPGAVKRGGKFRGAWWIPLQTAETWQRDQRGRRSIPAR